jgi:molybdopterin-guanine dinucleotide biosynthesis protein A
MSRSVDITGLVLADGHATRMDGVEKGPANLLGKPLVAHVREKLTSQVGPLLISAKDVTALR